MSITDLASFDRLPLELRRKIYQLYILGCYHANSHTKHIEIVPTIRFNHGIPCDRPHSILPDNLSKVSDRLAIEVKEAIETIHSTHIFYITNPWHTNFGGEQYGLPTDPLKIASIKILSVNLKINSLPNGEMRPSWVCRNVQSFRRVAKSLRLIYVRIECNDTMGLKIAPNCIDRTVRSVRGCLQHFRGVEHMRVQFTGECLAVGTPGARIVQMVATEFWDNLTVVNRDVMDSNKDLVF